MLKPARFIAYAIVTIVALAGLSCGGGGGDEEGTRDAAGQPTAEATDGEAYAEFRAVESLVQDVIEALQQRSTDGLRATLSEDVRGTVTEEDLGQLASCVPEGESLELGGVLVDATTGDAEITVATGAGDEPELVMQIWRLELQEDSSWALGALPPCPFE